MEYQALYRKYRPKNLKEVYGQSVAVNILKNAIQNNKFGHAYLFTGSRGCGKTSVAKIMSRLVNCENVVNGQLCGECKNCIATKDNSCVDILEIDAASNNGVDEIRELKSKVNLIPSILKYKVYIIDEVHMLSIGAFNALLKTLEEPPEHVIFILATTELNKVPITIVSRCQTIEFKKINNKDMFKRLREISDMEKIDITDDAITEIVNVSDGGLRDAIGMLDMSTTYTNNKITEEDIYAINGNVSNAEIEYLSDLIIKKNLNPIINLLNDYHNTGKDLVKIVEKLINNLTKQMIKENDTNICMMIKKISETLEKMKNTSIGKIYLEVCIFEICNKQQENNILTVPVEKYNNVPLNQEKEIEIKKNVEKESTVPVEIKKEDNDVYNNIVRPKKDLDEFKKIRVNNTFVDVDKKVKNEIVNKWNLLNDYTFDKENGALVCELLDAVPEAASNSYLILSYSYDSSVEKGNMYIEKYENVLCEYLGMNLKLVFLTQEEWKKYKIEYIENTKNKVQYNYIEESKIKLDVQNDDDSIIEKNQSEMIEKVNQLFDSSKIEIKGE